MPTELDSDILGEHEKFLVYGEFGTGKTFLSGTLPPPVYFLVIGPRNELKTLYSPDFTGKFGSPEAYKKENGYPKYIFDEVLEETGERGQFKEAHAFDIACDKLEAALEARRKGDLMFNSIVVENATTLMEVQMNKAMEIGYSLANNQSKTALKKYRDHNIRIVGDNDYMSAQSLMEQFVHWIYSLPFHLAFVAHEHQDTSFDRTSRQTSVRAIKPLFYGKHRTEIPRMFDNVFRTTVGGSGRSRVFEVQTVGSGDPDLEGSTSISAKVRLGGVLSPKERGLNLSDAIEQFKQVAK